MASSPDADHIRKLDYLTVRILIAVAITQLLPAQSFGFPRPPHLLARLRLREVELPLLPPDRVHLLKLLLGLDLSILRIHHGLALDVIVLLIVPEQGLFCVLRPPDAPLLPYDRFLALFPQLLGELFPILRPEVVLLYHAYVLIVTDNRHL